MSLFSQSYKHFSLVPRLREHQQIYNMQELSHTQTALVVKNSSQWLMQSQLVKIFVIITTNKDAVSVVETFFTNITF